MPPRHKNFIACFAKDWVILPGSVTDLTNERVCSCLFVTLESRSNSHDGYDDVVEIQNKYTGLSNNQDDSMEVVDPKEGTSATIEEVPGETSRFIHQH
ncbi:hypothetical protein TNCV_3580181 [Trichonephila clavipes]|nr:hypothetical protein TNCV_3580181 [Trichonephila clavipes]